MRLQTRVYCHLVLTKGPASVFWTMAPSDCSALFSEENIERPPQNPAPRLFSCSASFFMDEKIRGAKTEGPKYFKSEH